MFRILFASMLILLSGKLWSTPVTVTTFSPGTSISSSAMNTNFSSIVNAFNATNAGLYIFPNTAGTVGDVLTVNGGGTLSWMSVPVSSGISSLNGLTLGSQAFAISSSGAAPAWNSAGGVHTLDIPMASSGLATAGLISNSDYMNFQNKINNVIGSNGQALIWSGGWTPGNIFSPGGNAFGTTPTLGTTDAFGLGIKTNGFERMRIDQSGNVGIGTISPTSPLHILASPSTSADSASLKVQGTLNSTVGIQYGAVIDSFSNQGGSAGWTGLAVVVADSSASTGPKKLIDAAFGGVSKFSVDKNGYFPADGFMGSLISNITATCDTPAVYAIVPSMNMDFGNYAGSYTATAGVYEIILDSPILSGMKLVEYEIYNSSNSTTIAISPGRSVKRLSAGNWQLKPKCYDPAGPTTSVVSGNDFVFGMRRLH